MAIEHARDSQLTPEEMPHFYREDRGERVPEQKPGSVEYSVGDILDPDCCPGPYDIVICRNTVQHFIVEGRGGAVIDALLNRLSTSGLLVITSHFRVIRIDIRDTIYMYLHRTGIPFGAALPPQGPSGRFAWCFATTGGVL